MPAQDLATNKQLYTLAKYRLSAKYKNKATEMIQMIANNKWSARGIEETELFYECKYCFLEIEMKKEKAKVIKNDFPTVFKTASKADAITKEMIKEVFG